MRKSTIAIGIAAALSTQAFVTTTSADAAVKAKPQKASGPISSQPHFKYPNRVSPTGAVLYDQSGSAINGAPSQNFESSFDAYDNASADDFVVTDAAGWDVSAFNLQITIGDPSTATYDVNVYPDAGGLPGATATCTYSALAGTVDGSNTSLSVALSSPCHLNQGTYWVSVIANLDFGVGGQMFWSDDDPGNAAFNSPAVFQNPGDGFGTGCTSWAPLASCGGSSPVGGGSNNFLFQVVGAVGGGGTCGAGDLCLETTVGTDTSAGACATTDTLDVTVGDQVNFCYVITNNTGIELDYHTLSDNIDGTIFSLLNQPVPAGGTYQYNRIVTAGATETITSTWTGQDLPPGYAAEVTGGGGGGDRIFCDGFDGTACASTENGFIDITGTGTPLGNADDEAIAVTMPFSFNFYGTTSNNLCIDNNGFVLFNTTTCPTGGLYTNESLPSASLPAPAILAMWDDFDSESGDVYYDTRGTTPNRQFIVEWFDRVHYSGSTNTDGATFELILNEDGTIQFEYSDVSFTGGAEGDCSNGVCATIGLQNDTTLFNQFSAFEAAVTDNSGILWTPTNPQVFTGTDTMTLNVGAPDIDVQPPSLSGTVPEGGTSSIPFSIDNVGDRDLNWTADEAGPANLHFPPPGTRFAMPQGDPSTSTLAPAPIALRRPNNGQKPAHGSFHVPFGGGAVPVFAMDVYLSQIEQFDALAPGTVNVIAPVTGGQALVGGAFVDGDFSKMYAIDGFGSTGGTLYTVDTATGALTTVADASNNLGETYSGMDYDGTTGNLYASSSTCGSSSHLWTIDLNTGASTLVGTIGSAACIVAIAVNADGEMYGVDIFDDSLYAIDKSNGNASLIGTVGFNMNYAQDMAFDLSTGILYFAGFDGNAFTDSIYTVDLTTGLATLVGPIGPSLGEVDGMSIMTVGGPCAQPQDLPWLSLSPLNGTTAAGGSTPVTASLDGSGNVEGDTLSGTVCVTSNDPDEHTVEVPIEVTVGPPGTGGNVIDSGVINAVVPATTTGMYINWLTGDQCTASCTGVYNFNPYGSTTLTFFWSSPVTADSSCVATNGTSCDLLASGATIGPASVFADGNTANFLAGVDGYIGFQFINANTATVNYGYAHVTTTGPAGVPMTIVEYWYDNSGAAISIP